MRDSELNHRELERYVRRVADRWPVQRALLGGARVADVRGAPAQRERGPEYVIVLVSEHFDGVPWLERVYVGRARCGTPTRWALRRTSTAYTAAEFERKREQLRERARGGRARARAAARARRLNPSRKARVT